MTPRAYEYEDHIYRSQAQAYDIMPDYLCRPGAHKWRAEALDGSEVIFTVCEKCGLWWWHK